MHERLKVISGLGQKGPACFLLESRGKRFLLDAGIGPEKNVMPDLESIGVIDAVFITHCHPDHAGALNAVLKNRSVPVFASAFTLLRLGLYNSENTSILDAGCAYNIFGIPVLTGRSGHCPGGLTLHFDSGGGLLYMGDCSTESEVYLHDEPCRASTVILDCSYGDRDTKNDSENIAEMMASANSVFPVPLDGRGLDFLYIAEKFHLKTPYISPPLKENMKLALQFASQYLKKEAVQILTTALQKAEKITPDQQGHCRLIPDTCISLQREDERNFFISGYLSEGSPQQALMAAGRASLFEWNVHSRLSENLFLAGKINAVNILPAFCSEPKIHCIQNCFPRGLTVSREVFL